MRGDQFFAEASKRPPFTKLHPKLAAFFKDYFAHEKAVRFLDYVVVNTHFPPYPSRAFDNLAEGFRLLGDADERRLYSVTLAVTNRCDFNCCPYSAIRIFSILSPWRIASITSRPSTTLPKQVCMRSRCEVLFRE